MTDRRVPPITFNPQQIPMPVAPQSEAFFRPDVTSSGLDWPQSLIADLQMAEQNQQYGDAYEAAQEANARKLEEVMRGIEMRKAMSRAFEPPERWPLMPEMPSPLAKR